MRKQLKNKNLTFMMPVLLISTYDDEGKVNVMNAAWVTLEDSDVILIQLTSDHKTSKNILSRKAFTVSNATLNVVEAADYCGLVSGNDVEDKFEKMKLHSHPSQKVDAPIIDELPVTMECSLLRIDETNGDFAVYGKIESVEVDDRYLDENGRLDIEACQFITYNPMDHSYRLVGKKVANAFQCGLKMKQ